MEPWLWVGDIGTGEIERRAPKNVGTQSGYYDEPGGLANEDARLEDHLARIESDAARALRELASRSRGARGAIPAAITRFLAWQAARTPAFHMLFERWISEASMHERDLELEPPPDGFERIAPRDRPKTLVDPTGAQRDVSSPGELRELLRTGWRWVPSQADRLELTHLQAWYLQVRHFPRLSWVVLDAPEGWQFITSDRPVAWGFDGLSDAPPFLLRHPSVMVLAPLNRSLALVAHHGALDGTSVTTTFVNGVIAYLARKWIAGSAREVIETALEDRKKRGA
jgi:hypothetical protein